MPTARSVHDPDQTTFSRILQTRGGRSGACRYCAYDYQALLRHHRIMAQPFTSGELLGQRRDGELFPFAEGRAGVPDALRQLPGGKNRPVRLHPLFTITADATRRWAISVRWNLSGKMRAVALNYLSTSSGADQIILALP